MTDFDYALPYPSRRSPVLARNVVSTSQPMATQAGLRMLQKGGNAVDAALAAAMALVVVEPTGCGMGGDCFAILWDGSALHGLNASGRSPAGWTRDRFAGHDEMPGTGWDAVTVPGVVSGWVELSRRFGKLPFAKLFEPAIGYAEQGYHVSPIISRVWAAEAERLKDQPGYADCFMPGGRAPRAGELFRNPGLGASLRSVAETGGASFYEGELAGKIVDFAKAHGGCMTREDLAARQPDWCGTIHAPFHGANLHEIPPNGQGIAAAMALGILEHTGIADLLPDSPESLHLQIEAMKIAFADVHAQVADIVHMKVAPDELLDPAYLSRRAALINPDRAGTPQPGVPKEGGTVYLSAADDSGMMVSFIQSNYEGFGSGLVVPGTGISLHNRGSDFVLEQGHPNEVAPNKRPFHTIIPGFLMRDGAPLMSFGVMGGGMQAQGHVQMVIRTQLWRQNPQAASDAPRWRVMPDGRLAVEAGMPEDYMKALAALGHEVATDPLGTTFGFGGAQLIHRIEGGYAAGSDHRKDGHAGGFLTDPRLAVGRAPSSFLVEEAAMTSIWTRRAYDEPGQTDGQRILVDRVWPRGVSKEDLKLDDWLKEIAPSDDLRQWFDHDPDKWDEFRSRYAKELQDATDAVQELRDRLAEGRVTLVYGAKDEEHNNAVALKDWLERNA